MILSSPNKEILTIVADKQEAQELLLTNKKLAAAAQARVLQAGFTYPVSVRIGKFHFPFREYGDFSLPVGIYDAVRVEIGSAAGDNWWCVLFPPLCLADLDGTNNGLLRVNEGGEGNSYAFRLKIWDHISHLLCPGTPEVVAGICRRVSLRSCTS